MSKERSPSVTCVLFLTALCIAEAFPSKKQDAAVTSAPVDETTVMVVTPSQSTLRPGPKRGQNYGDHDYQDGTPTRHKRSRDSAQNQSQNSTQAPGQNLTQSQSQNSTQSQKMTQPQGSTGAQPQSPTGTQPQSPSGTQPQSPTGTQPQSPTGTQPQSPTGTQPQSPTGTQPQSPTAAKPQSPTAAKPQSLTASLSESPTSTQPQSQKVTQPQGQNSTMPANATKLPAEAMGQPASRTRRSIDELGHDKFATEINYQDQNLLRPKRSKDSLQTQAQNSTVNNSSVPTDGSKPTGMQVGGAKNPSSGMLVDGQTTPSQGTPVDGPKSSPQGVSGSKTPSQGMQEGQTTPSHVMSADNPRSPPQAMGHPVMRSKRGQDDYNELAIKHNLRADKETPVRARRSPDDDDYQDYQDATEAPVEETEPPTEAPTEPPTEPPPPPTPPPKPTKGGKKGKRSAGEEDEYDDASARHKRDLLKKRSPVEDDEYDDASARHKRSLLLRMKDRLVEDLAKRMKLSADRRMKRSPDDEDDYDDGEDKIQMPAPEESMQAPAADGDDDYRDDEPSEKRKRSVDCGDRNGRVGEGGDGIRMVKPLL